MREDFGFEPDAQSRGLPLSLFNGDYYCFFILLRRPLYIVLEEYRLKLKLEKGIDSQIILLLGYLKLLENYVKLF